MRSSGHWVPVAWVWNTVEGAHQRPILLSRLAAAWQFSRDTTLGSGRAQTRMRCRGPRPRILVHITRQLRMSWILAVFWVLVGEDVDLRRHRNDSVGFFLLLIFYILLILLIYYLYLSRFLVFYADLRGPSVRAADSGRSVGLRAPGQRRESRLRVSQRRGSHGRWGFRAWPSVLDGWLLWQQAFWLPGPIPFPTLVSSLSWDSLN